MTEYTLVHDAANVVVGPDEGTEIETVADASVVAVDGRVADVGPTDEILREYPVETAETAVDASEKLVTPGFVDPHTHALFAGDRTDEFAAKLGGTSYEEILAQGGGILRTVRAVREASVEDLTATLRAHLDVMLENGTTTVEVKSGYGLDTETELRMLAAIERAHESHPVDVVATFMGAHAVPEDSDAETYTEQVIEEQIPAVAEQGVAEFCDVFCERDVFTADQTRRILRAGIERGLKPKVHADEFARIGAADAAADVGAVSADHLLQTDDEGRDALVDAGVVPVMLPGTAFALGEGYADAGAFLDRNTPVALATDFNPNCYSRSMGFATTLGCVGMRMTPGQSLRGTTHAAATALDRDDGTGTLREGAPADLLVHDVTSPVEIPYTLDVNTVETVLKDGVVVRE